MIISTDGTYVVSGNLISATEPDTKLISFEDIIYSGLLCQLAADKKFSRLEDPVAWLSFYKISLTNIFWNFTRSETITHPISQSKAKITIQEILEKNFFKYLNIEQKNKITSSIKVFNTLGPDSAASVLYNSKTRTQEKSSTAAVIKPPIKKTSFIDLQVSVAHSQAHTSVCSIYFKTSQTLGEDLFKQEFAVKDLIGNINVFNFDAEVIEANYALIRQSVIDKLGEEKICANIMLLEDEPVSPEPSSQATALQFVRSMEL